MLKKWQMYIVWFYLYEVQNTERIKQNCVRLYIQVVILFLKKQETINAKVRI